MLPYPFRRTCMEASIKTTHNPLSLSYLCNTKVSQKELNGYSETRACLLLLLTSSEKWKPAHLIPQIKTLAGWTNRMKAQRNEFATGQFCALQQNSQSRHLLHLLSCCFTADQCKRWSHTAVCRCHVDSFARDGEGAVVNTLTLFLPLGATRRAYAR